MKLKLRQLIESLDHPMSDGSMRPGAFSRLLSTELVISASMRMKGVTKQVRELAEQFSDLRLSLYKKHGTESEAGDEWALKTDAQKAAFAAEFEELLNVDIEISGDRLKKSDFFSHARMIEGDLETLDWLIDCGESPQTKPIAWKPSSTELGQKPEITTDLEAMQTRVDEAQPGEILDLGEARTASAARTA